MSESREPEIEAIGLVDVDGDGTVDAVAELDENGEVVAIAVAEESDEA